jgi:hypothetical protein
MIHLLKTYPLMGHVATLNMLLPDEHVYGDLPLSGT